MRWPETDESKHAYAMYMRDLLIERGWVVSKRDHRDPLEQIVELLSATDPASGYAWPGDSTGERRSKVADALAAARAGLRAAGETP